MAANTICSPAGVGFIDAWHRNRSHKISFQSKSKWFGEAFLQDGRRWLVPDCVSPAYGGDIVMRRLPSISPPAVIMHRPARSNFLISPTVVTLISVGRTRHRHHRPQSSGVDLHISLISRWWDRLGQVMGKECATRTFPVPTTRASTGPDLGDSAVAPASFPSFPDFCFIFDLPFCRPRCCAGSSG